MPLLSLHIRKYKDYIQESMTDLSSAITALTTGIELYGVHTYLGLKVLPFL